jgi:DNA replication protein DnaC
MNYQATKEKMRSLRLLGMMEVFESLQTTQTSDLTNDQLVALLIDSEWESRVHRRTQRLIKTAGFRYYAGIEELDYSAQRNLDKNTMLRLADCSFIEKGTNVIITGSTGVGKSFVATALGYQACIKGYKVLYENTNKLFTRLRMAKADESYLKVLAKIEKQDLLILDDFGLQAIDHKKQLALLDILEDRQMKRSTIITTQLPINVWYELFEEKTIADAIMDRITHNAIRIELKGESMRKMKKLN